MFNWGIACLSLVALAMILRELSKRLGQALHLKRYYLLYDAGIVLLLAATGAMIAELTMTENGLISASSRLSFLAGTLLIVGATARYWTWVIPEVMVSSRK
jgi:membrane-bound ClpP family serine protease